MYAIINSESNVIEVSICKIKLEDKLKWKLFYIAHDSGMDAQTEKVKELDGADISDPEVDEVINLAYQDAYDYKFAEIQDEFKIYKWDSKNCLWV